MARDRGSCAQARRRAARLSCVSYLCGMPRIIARRHVLLLPSRHFRRLQVLGTARASKACLSHIVFSRAISLRFWWLRFHCVALHDGRGRSEHRSARLMLQREFSVRRAHWEKTKPRLCDRGLDGGLAIRRAVFRSACRRLCVPLGLAATSDWPGRRRCDRSSAAAAERRSSRRLPPRSNRAAARRILQMPFWTLRQHWRRPRFSLSE
jgi:hypothetical protein